MDLMQTKMLEDSMLMVLKSKANPEGFTDRSDIIYMLPNIYSFPRNCEVALRTLTYTPNTELPEGQRPLKERRVVKTRRRHVHFHERPLPHPPIFPGYVPPVVATRPIPKTENSLISFITKFNETIGPTIGVTLIIAFTVVNREEMIIHLNYNEINQNKYLFVSPQLAEVLGFNRTQFTRGRFVASTSVTQASFEEYDLNANFAVSVVEDKYFESTMKLRQRFDSLFGFRKLTMNFVTFFESVKTYLAQCGFRLTFSFDATKRCTLHVEGTPIDHEQDYLVISRNLLECLGFNYDKFALGTYQSAVPFDEAKFTALLQDELIFFRYAVHFDLFLILQEPASMNLIDVLHQINTTLEKQRYQDYNAVFSYTNGNLLLTGPPEHVAILLPPKIEEYFGIAAGTWFTAGVPVSTGREVLDQEEEVEVIEDDAAGSAPSHSKKLLITSNVVRGSVYGDKTVELLREVTMSEEYKKECRIEFNPVIWLPVCCKQVNQIRVNFCDEENRPIKFDSKETSATIEFRIRK